MRVFKPYAPLIPILDNTPDETSENCTNRAKLDLLYPFMDPYMELWECKGVDTFWRTGSIRVNRNSLMPSFTIDLMRNLIVCTCNQEFYGDNNMESDDQHLIL